MSITFNGDIGLFFEKDQLSKKIVFVPSHI